MWPGRVRDIHSNSFIRGTLLLVPFTLGEFQTSAPYFFDVAESVLILDVQSNPDE